EMDPLGRLVARRIILTPVEATATPTIPPLPSPTASATGVPIAVGEWRGEYYDNVELSGEPPLVRGDSVLDFRWGEGPPAPGLPADGFSARWRGRWAFDEGGYRFYAYADNGIRVWADDRLVIDTWRDQEPTLTTADVYLEAGQRDLRVDYYHRRDEAIVRVWWDYRGLYPDWKGEYFSNPDLVGEPTVIRNDSELRFDWGPRSPAAGIPADRFSVRWTRTVQFEEGAYRFFARADDGVRVWVDQALVVDEWHESTPRTYVEHLWVDAGPRTVRVEFYENGGNAFVQVWWERIERFDHWMGAYYANPDAAGRPVFLRDDERLDFDWGEGSPGQGIPVDNFSARWTRTLAFEGGPYRFSASADDGVRLYVDGKLLIDQWREPAAGRHTADVTLSQGMHTIVVEYYDRAGNARLQIGWEALPTPTPTSTGAGTPESPTATATETPYPSPPATIPASSAG
ncbi:MAG: hypothetical protein FJZ90_14655, partial [Chloroflexi bacterium]|nr:hypothetical protein [Chloroflexota bacterium]